MSSLQSTQIGLRSFNFDDRMIGDIQQAIQTNNLIDIEYQSFTSSNATHRTIEPIQLALLNRIWMRVAYCRLRKDVRNFRLDRIGAYKVQRETFSPRTLKLKRFADPGGRCLCAL